MPRLSGRAILAALIVKINENARREAFEIYISECLRMISENTAKSAGGKYIDVSFSEIISPSKKTQEGEIFDRIKNKFRG